MSCSCFTRSSIERKINSRPMSKSDKSGGQPSPVTISREACSGVPCWYARCSMCWKSDLARIRIWWSWSDNFCIVTILYLTVLARLDNTNIMVNQWAACTAAGLSWGTQICCMYTPQHHVPVHCTILVPMDQQPPVVDNNYISEVALVTCATFVYSSQAIKLLVCLILLCIEWEVPLQYS